MDTNVHMSGEDAGEWYENDLQLAAELGKALLDRNRELEGQLLHAQQLDADRQLEVEYLSRQLEVHREATEAKNHIYEEIDKAMQELEKSNQKYQIDCKADKQKIERLTDTVQSLEEKNEELSKRVEDQKAAERERRKMEKQQNKDTRRARSLANLPDHRHNKELLYGNIGNWTYNELFKKSNLPLNPYEIEIRNLQELLKNLKAQNLFDKRKKEDFETEVALLWEENTSLEVKLKILEDDLFKYKKLHDDIQQIKLESGKLCSNCGKTLAALKRSDGLEGELEDDEPKFTSEGRIVKMESGGSVYGSRESLDQVAMETKETMTSIDSPEDPDTAGISILNEIEAQYQALFKKYELLLQKGRRPSSMLLEDEDKFEEDWQKRLSHKSVQTTLKIHKQGDDLDNPPYKALFRDIFTTLKKSRIEELGEGTGPTDGAGGSHGMRNVSPVPDAR